MRKIFIFVVVLSFVVGISQVFADSVLIQDTTVGAGVPSPSGLNTFYNNNGVASTIISDGATITGADLAGKNLFVGYEPSAGYLASEITAFSGFLAGGGRILFMGENGSLMFQPTNNAISAAISALGGGTMASDNNTYDGAGFHDATVGNGQILPNPLTAGVNTLNYAAPSGITGSGSKFFLTTDLIHVFGESEGIGSGSIVFVSDSNLLDNLGLPSNDNGQFFLNLVGGGVSPVPEPTTLILVGSALIGLWGFRKTFTK